MTFVEVGNSNDCSPREIIHDIPYEFVTKQFQNVYKQSTLMNQKYVYLYLASANELGCLDEGIERVTNYYPKKNLTIVLAM